MRFYTIQKNHSCKTPNCSKQFLKPTCFHFPIFYLKQRTFSFLEQRSRIKLSSLSLLMDTTRTATLLLRKNRKSSNIGPHYLYLFLCLLFADQQPWVFFLFLLCFRYTNKNHKNPLFYVSHFFVFHRTLLFSLFFFFSFHSFKH